MLGLKFQPFKKFLTILWKYDLVMRIESLGLKNFRCFEDINIEFGPNFNIIIGDNGSGKSALLRGLCVAVSSFFLGIDGTPNRKIQRNDIRMVHYEDNVEYKFPTEVICHATIESEAIIWNIKKAGKSKGTRLINSKIKKIAQSLQQQVRNGNNVNLPVLAYFPSRRNWEPPEKMNLVKKESRFKGYDNAINPTTNYKFFTEWFKTKELAALQKQENLYTLQVVKKAVNNCIEECNSIYYDINTGALVMKFSDGRILPFNRLSDGVKNMMAVVSDIAYRCVTLNPHLKENALESWGVILIDELDLHLHPSWQKKIVADLKRTFPNIQFITTTHSPLILSTVSPIDKIIALEIDKFEYISRLYGRTVNDILNFPMKTYPTYKELDDYFELIELGQGKSENAFILRKKIEELSGTDFPELSRADTLIAFYE